MLRADPRRIARLRRALDDFGYDALQRSLRGGFPRTPFPPYQEFSRTLRRIPERPRTWLGLLLLGRRLAAGQVEAALGAGLVDDLLELGVLHARDDRLDTGGLGLVCYRDRYLLATLEASYPTNRDPALTLYAGPSSYRLADALPLGRRFGAVLDMCAGPGLLGILLAPAAQSVVLADLLEPAVAAARFNAALNGLTGRVEAIRSDLYTALGARRFDFVVMNPPFVARPADQPGAPFADGGPTGMRVLAPLLEGLPKRLARDGWALSYLEGPGDPERPFFADRLSQVAGRALEIELLLVARTTAAAALGQMARREQGATHFYAMLARIRRGAGGVSVVNAIPRKGR